MFKRFFMIILTLFFLTEGYSFYNTNFSENLLQPVNQSFKEYKNYKKHSTILREYQEQMKQYQKKVNKLFDKLNIAQQKNYHYRKAIKILSNQKFQRDIKEKQILSCLINRIQNKKIVFPYEYIDSETGKQEIYYDSKKILKIITKNLQARNNILKRKISNIRQKYSIQFLLKEGKINFLNQLNEITKKTKITKEKAIKITNNINHDFFQLTNLSHQKECNMKEEIHDLKIEINNLSQKIKHCQRIIHNGGIDFNCAINDKGVAGDITNYSGEYLSEIKIYFKYDKTVKKTVKSVEPIVLHDFPKVGYSTVSGTVECFHTEYENQTQNFTIIKKGIFDNQTMNFRKRFKYNNIRSISCLKIESYK